MTGRNRELADRLRAQADDHKRKRTICLAAFTALSTTSTPAAAVKTVRDSMIPDDLRAEIIKLIELLAATP